MLFSKVWNEKKTRILEASDKIICVYEWALGGGGIDKGFVPLPARPQQYCESQFVTPRHLFI